MATLNIEDVPEDLYRRLTERAKENGRSLDEEVRQILDTAMKQRSLLELAGKGRELWQKELQGKDAAEYIGEQRDQWK